jgi:hypothetical protein
MVNFILAGSAWLAEELGRLELSAHREEVSQGDRGKVLIYGTFAEFRGADATGGG